VIGGSGYFDGNGDTLQATAGAVPAIGTSDFTISGWWYLNELKNYQIFFDFRNGTNVEAVPYLYMGSTGLADYFLNGSSNNLSINFRANEWSYVVVSRVSGTTKIFINGAQALSISDSTNYVAGRLNLGFNNSGGTAYYYNGYISDFKLVIGTGTTSGTPPTAPATATSGTQALLSMTNGAIFDNAMMSDLETAGSAQILTSVKKFGTGSIYFDGSNSYLVTLGQPIYSFGTGDFTIECWLNITSFNGGVVFDFRPNGLNGDYITVYLNSSALEFYAGSTTRITSGTLTTATWFHFALCRSGSSTKMFIDGTQAGSTYTASVSYTVGTKLGIGTSSFALASSLFDGYIDDLRITKGYARYTANFTPPTSAFSNFGPT
jgi:hypothetical protein